MSGFSCPTLWQADHTIPLAEGGQNNLANGRTLCLCCHKAETKALAKRLAQRRKALQLSLFAAVVMFGGAR